MAGDDEALFRQMLGVSFNALPTAVRRAHGMQAITLKGTAEVETFLGVFGRGLCWIMGLPKAGKDISVTVEFLPLANGSCRWRREFAGRRYESVFSKGTGAETGSVIETMGPITAVFRLTVDEARLKLEIVRSRWLGIPFPRIFSPACIAYESEENGYFKFDILISLRPFGPLIAYRGLLQ